MKHSESYIPKEKLDEVFTDLFHKLEGADLLAATGFILTQLYANLGHEKFKEFMFQNLAVFEEINAEKAERKLKDEK